MGIRFFEGVRDQDREAITRRNMERRFYALAAAVRDHEANARRNGRAARRDEALYRRLRQLSGEPATAEDGLAQ